MAYNFTITPQSTQILWSIQPECTVVNTGATTVYLDSTSAVSSVQGFQLPPGASMRAGEDVELWAVTGGDSGAVQLFFEGDELQVPPSSAVLVYSGTATSGTFAPQGLSNQQFNAVSVLVRWPSGAAVAQITATVQTLQTGASQTVSGVVSYAGRAMEVVLPGYVASVSSPGYPAYSGAVFPLQGNGFKWAVYGAATGCIVEVYGLPVDVPAPMPWTMNNNAGSVPDTFRADSNSSWYPNGNTWTLGTLTQAAATTATYTFPPVCGPCRVIVSYTQTGAGASSAKLQAGMAYKTGVFPVKDWIQYDTNIAAATAAGAVYGAATYAVWPTSGMQIVFTTAAGVTLSAITVTVISGVL